MMIIIIVTMVKLFLFSKINRNVPISEKKHNPKTEVWNYRRAVEKFDQLHHKPRTVFVQY